MSFLNIIRQQAAKAPVQLGPAGDVAEASEQMIRDEIPELLATVGMPSSQLEAMPNKRGTTGLFFAGLAKNNVGCKYFARHILLTPQIAKWILAKFYGKNRISTMPGIKRYTEDQKNGRWYFVGNTLCFTVDHRGALIATGDCNGRHTCNAVVKSGVAIDVLVLIGIPEEYAMYADRNIVRSSKDETGRMHRFDKYKGDRHPLTGEHTGVTIDADDIKTLDSIHSQAVRIISCVNSRKQIKDSTPLLVHEFVALDRVFGDVLEKCVFNTFLLDRTSRRENDKGTSVPGGLKYRLSLSHVAAVMCVIATTGDEICDASGKRVGVKNLKLEDESTNGEPSALEVLGKFFVMLTDENYVEDSEPAVTLRRAMSKLKTAGITNQNLKWNVLCRAIYSYAEIQATGDTSVDFDIDSLVSITADSKDRTCFQTLLDPFVPEAKTEAVAELEEETEENEEMLEEV